MNKLNDEQIHRKGVAHAMTVMAQKMIYNENVIVNAFHHFMQDNEWKKRIIVQNHFLSTVLCHRPNNYKDTKPYLSSLLVFNKVYIQERHSVMLVFSTPLVN